MTTDEEMTLLDTGFHHLDDDALVAWDRDVVPLLPADADWNVRLFSTEIDPNLGYCVDCPSRLVCSVSGNHDDFSSMRFAEWWPEHGKWIPWRRMKQGGYARMDILSGNGSQS